MAHSPVTCIEGLCLRTLFLPAFSKKGRSGARGGGVWNSSTETLKLRPSEVMVLDLPVGPRGILGHLHLYSGAGWPRSWLMREARLWMRNDRGVCRESITAGMTEPAVRWGLWHSQPGSPCFDCPPSSSHSPGLTKLLGLPGVSQWTVDLET